MTGLEPESRYQLFETLGQGTSGVVYRARDHRLGRDVALKLLRGDRLGEGNARRRLEREARVAAAFRHPNAVEIYEIGELAGQPFLAMELVRGRSLAAQLEETAIAGARAAAQIGRSLAEVLAAAHDAGLVHRDVKPSNVFVDGPLDAPRRVRLVDFGLAFLLEPSTHTLGRLTDQGMVVGTPAYMAPEQADGREVGPPADVYALGCMLYELASGRTPFLGNIPRMITGHLYLPPIPLSELELADEVPPRLANEILRMLDKTPEERPTAAEVRDRLAELDDDDDRAFAHRSRAERCVAAQTSGPAQPGPHPGAEGGPAGEIRVAAIQAGAAVDDALRAAGVAVVSPDEAELILVPIDDEGRFDPAWRDRPVVGLHPAPTPLLIARAIRHGAALVLRVPLAQPDLARRLGALARSQRVTRG